MTIWFIELYCLLALFIRNGTWKHSSVSQNDMKNKYILRFRKKVPGPLYQEILIYRTSDAYMRQLARPTYVLIMACRLFVVKPLSEPMLPYRQLNIKEYVLVKFYAKFTSFHSRKCTGICRLCNGGHLSRPQSAKASTCIYSNIKQGDVITHQHLTSKHILVKPLLEMDELTDVAWQHAISFQSAEVWWGMNVKVLA